MARIIFKAILCVTAAFYANAASTMTPEERSDKLNQATVAIREHHPDQAIALADQILDDFNANIKPNTVYWCADNQSDMLGLLIKNHKADKRTVVVMDFGPCSAAFLKGFALIDENRSRDAEPYLRQAEEMAPLSPHYMNEYAEWYKNEKQWQKAFDLFKEAESRALLSASAANTNPHARALRGMGFCLTELGKLDEAEAKFNESLKFQPDSEAARSELVYIKQLRARAARAN